VSAVVLALAACCVAVAATPQPQTEVTGVITGESLKRRNVEEHRRNRTINRLILGDERYFLGAKILGTKEPPRHAVIVKPGETVQISAFVVNDAEFPGPGSTAHGTRFRLAVPTNNARVMPISGYISAENAQPSYVYDLVYLRSNERFSVEYLS
jgi:hypothetical protein